MDILIFLIIFLPLIASILLLLPFVPDIERTLRHFCKFFSTVTLLLTVILSIFFDFTQSDFAIEVSYQWINILGINASFLIDTLSIFMLVLAAFIFLISIHISKSIIKTSFRLYYSLIMMLETSIMGVLCAKDLFIFLMFLISAIAPVFILISKWGDSRKSAVRYIIYKLIACAFLFIGFILIYYLNFKYTGTLSADINDIDVSYFPDTIKNFICIILIAGFGINLYIFPFHKHQIEAVTNTPISVSIILSSVFTNAALIPVLRYVIPLFQSEYADYANTVTLFIVLNILYAILCMMGEKNLKRILAYTNMVNAGIVLFGFTSLTAAGITGGMYQLISYSFVITGLFIIQDYIFRQYGTNNIKRIKGICSEMPRLAAISLLFFLCAGFIPLLGCFPSLFLSVTGLLLTSDIKIISVLLMIFSLLAGIKLFSTYNLIFKGSKQNIRRKLQDIKTKQFVILIMIASCIIFIGLFPFVITDIISEYANTAFNFIGVY